MILATQEPQTLQPNPTPTVPQDSSVITEAEIQRKSQQQAHIVGRLIYYWNRILTIGLSLYAARGVWLSAEFIIFQHPELNTKLERGLISPLEVNQLTGMVVTLVITTAISLVLAWRLHNVRRETGPTLDLIVSMLFLGISPMLEKLISMINFVSLFGTLF